MQLNIRGGQRLWRGPADAVDKPAPTGNKRKVLWWDIEACITRWRIEETIRFIKQSYQQDDTG